ncbi:importin-alpha export receptor [Nowakowskiella sp. JEL0407]|nr:importin-alpha export receptor [Nowakowskiella sp. JEL0407]
MNGNTDLTEVLKLTLDPSKDKRKNAELMLLSFEKQPGFLLALLEIIKNRGIEFLPRECAVLYFKNFLKKFWAPSEGDPDLISESDRTVIKQQIVTIMSELDSKKIQLQLQEAVGVIADHDFPVKWTGLIVELVQKLVAAAQKSDMLALNGVLSTASVVFMRWRKRSLDNAMALEIRDVINEFIEPYRQVLAHIHQLIEAHKSDKAAVTSLFESLETCLKIFYDFNYHEIPEFFEDNHTELMMTFHHYLITDFPVLHTDDDSTAGPLENVRARIAEITDLYAKRYEEEFTTLPVFVETIWKILTTVGTAEKNDEFVSKSIGFLSSVVKLGRHKDHFKSPETLRSILEKIVLPNMELRESDVELFEDEPVSWIRKDVEGTEGETRRSAATELIRSLLVNFATEVTQLGSEYVGKYLQLYQTNPAENWKAKDTAFFLITALTMKSQTAKAGVVEINSLVQVLPIFVSNVLPDLQLPVDSIHPLIKVDAIKYLLLFRSQLEKEHLRECLTILLAHLKSTNTVVYTYAAICIERILGMKEPGTYALRFKPQDVKPIVEKALEELMLLIVKPNQTPEKLAENDYLMKAVARVIQISQGDTPLAAQLLPQMMKIITVISQNPSNPIFNHFVFETMSSLVRFMCGRDPSLVPQFENALMPLFGDLLARDVQEFTPYVFQIISQLIELQQGTGVPEHYKAMLNNFLLPQYWESHGNIPALEKLVQSFLTKDPAYIVSSNTVPAILGVIQRLLQTKFLDECFSLLMSLFEYIDSQALAQYVTPIFSMLATKMTHTKSPRIRYWFDTFFLFFVTLEKPGYSADAIIGAFNAVQPNPPNFFERVYSAVLLTTVAEVISIENRRICAIGLAKLISNSKVILAEPYLQYWPQLITALSLLVKTKELTEVKDGNELEDLEEYGYQASFARLNSGKVKKSRYADVDLKKKVGELFMSGVNAQQVRQDDNMV